MTIASPASDLVATCTRTLLASGYVITASSRQPRHIEILCERRVSIGAQVRFLVAITDQPGFAPNELEDLQHVAAQQARALALIASEPGPEQLTDREFLDALGGAIPSWRALTAEYSQSLRIAATNALPPGLVGEPWQVFEDLAADGFEFTFGRRVQRMGGRQRGRAVSDMLAQMPDMALLVIDAKATAAAFDVSTDTLRALGEYVRLQKQRQTGYNEIFSAILVSSGFAQKADRLGEISTRFYADWGVPISMLAADDLAKLVEAVKEQPAVRNAVPWRNVFSGGRVNWSVIGQELKRAAQERYGSTD